MEKEIAARERASGPRKTPREVATATTLVSSSSSMPRCAYIRQTHSSTSCRSVTNPVERKRILQRTGHCFICLRKNHMSRDCRSNLKCGRCNGRHHISICPENQQAATTGSTTQGGSSHSRQEIPLPITTNSLPVRNETTPATSSSLCCVVLMLELRCYFKLHGQQYTI